MFLRHQIPSCPSSEDLVRWLEEKFDKEKLIAIGKIDDYFIFIDFVKWCQATVRVMERVKKSGQ